MDINSTVIINKEKCIGCGQCCKDCPSHVLELQGGKATTVSEQCLKCGHCIAICPKNAVTISEYDMSEVQEIEKDGYSLDPKQLMQHLMFRRSIRRYKNIPVESEKINRIIEAGRYTPTGSNEQGVRYIVLQNSIPMLEEAGIEKFKQLKKIASVLSKFIRLPYDLNKYKLEPGFLFQGAPLLILAISEDDVDAALASMSMELMAEAQGLGTLYAGLFIRAARHSKKIRNMLNLKKKEKVVAGLAIGYPDVIYQRTAPRKKADVQLI
ncbi:ferredoxin-2 [Clostridium puniceum]|uniref:Ferredoxin-2 n=1 Tax=Clostridium puniceum TaxID=29367 RepID=A0A1S8T897_9CLOT|nr:nitroreductase family protein [Clostridium puniceum]OOM73821.1 ferredoxin-2 [Clostridium puniceum]